MSLLGAVAGAAAGSSAFAFRPRAVLTVAGQRLTSAEAALVRLEVKLSAAGSHDAAQIMLWHDSKLVSPSVGDSMSIAMGDDGSEVDVWAGEVSAIQARADGVVIDGLAATIAFSKKRTSQSYLSQSVADIVNDLAGSSPVDEVEGDTQLEAYAVDERRSVWSHFIDLAALVGADLGASPAGGLRFVAPKTGAASATLRHGAELLAWRIGASAAPDASTVAAYGAASESGSDKWHWLLNTPSAAGSGAGPLRVVAALRTRDAAEVMARALSDRAARRALRGRLVITGNPNLRPGDLVETKDLPSGNPGTLRVLAVEHVLDARAGFYSTLSVEGASS